MTSPQWTNWAGNQRAVAQRVAEAGGAEQVAEIVGRVRESGGTLKAVGSGHSFTGAARTDGVRLAPASGRYTVDREAKRVTVPAGMPLHELNRVLAAVDLALPNLGDIDRQTIAGAISTGTHGTGAKLGGLATFVAGLTLVTGTGEIVHASPTENPDVFEAARLGVGAVGVLTELELSCVDSFPLRADERPMPLDTVLSTVDELAAANDHFEFYWFPYTELTSVKRNNRLGPDEAPHPLPKWRHLLDDELLSNTAFSVLCKLVRRAPALAPRVNGLSARALSARSYADRSDRVFCTPRRVRFVEMEYSVPREALTEAFAGLRRAVETCGVHIAFPVEVRVAAADDVWLSTAHGRDAAYLAVHQYVGMAYEPYFRAVEAVLRDLDGRPHWGKLHWRDADSLRATYPRFDDFVAVRDRLDPDRVFANDYTRRVFGD
ncbi:D-arabinono-1,4-lactone oxidase [Actinocatenispora comari]|uniref:L-gulonolactone oxidase n=1 Tax=Actinocatenispora comari TaxID=2807577 RepID=A0A8J4A6P3_9ACTN|nr:D-arabinono-1,4-lactone oxidase [Actinocatenispora comari]GIL25273.1 L-gulonolactone oxidase [Actinocatenispora comari]